MAAPDEPTDLNLKWSEPTDLAKKWAEPTSGQHYSTGRFVTEKRRDRDSRLIAALSRRVASRAPALSEPISHCVDVPCGSGRLTPFLSTRYQRLVSLDISPTMLQAHPGTWRLRASAFALPLPNQSFDVVICCRLFHHLRENDKRQALLEELLRVARGPVLMSFWDARSWHAWRRKVGLRKVSNQDGRIAIAKRDLEGMIQGAGGQVLAYQHSLLGISQQAWVAMQASGQINRQPQ